jgi:hypothetical protein
MFTFFYSLLYIFQPLVVKLILFSDRIWSLQSEVMWHMKIKSFNLGTLLLIVSLNKTQLLLCCDGYSLVYL